MKKGTIQAGRELKTKKASLYRDGYEEEKGLSIWIPISGTTTVIVGRTEHRIEDVEILENRIESKISNWAADWN